MASWIIDAIGAGAGLLSMASFVPQILKIAREKDASGVSLRMFSVTLAAFGLWTTYGVLSGALPVAASNFVCLVLVSAIVVLRLRFGDSPKD